MILRAAVVLMVLFVAALLQTALLPALGIGGFRPDLLLAVTVAFALREGPAAGARVGFLAGVVADVLLAESVLGLTALVLVLVGATVGAARPYLAPDSATAPWTLTFVAAAVATAGYGAVARLLGDERYSLDLVLSATVVVALSTTLMAPPVHAVVRRLCRRFPAQQVATA